MALKNQQNSDTALPLYFEKYMEEKFGTLHEKLDDADDWRKSIDLSIKEMNHFLATEMEQNKTHYVICPNTKILNVANVLEIQKQVEELAFIRKYHKAFLISGLVTFVIFCAGLFTTYITITDYINKQHNITIEAIKQEEQSIFIDQTNKKRK